MTMKENGDKVRRKLPNITKTDIIIGLAMIGVFLTAGMFTFHLGVWDIQNETVGRLQQQAEDLFDIQNSLLESSEKQDKDAKARSELASKERQFQINQTEQLKGELRSYVQILAERQATVVDEIEKEILNHTKEVIGSHNNMIEILKQPQSNFTAQKQAVANIEQVLNNQEEILQKLNNTPPR